MSSVTKKLVVFGAEYLVIAEGLLFVCVAFQKNTVNDTIMFIFFGVTTILVSLFAAHLLKLFFHRNRPPKSEELFVPGDLYAFPSKHATGLAALSVVATREDIAIALLIILLGIVIIVCRVLARVHRTRDMVVGVVLGVTVANIFEKYISPLVASLINL